MWCWRDGIMEVNDLSACELHIDNAFAKVGEVVDRITEEWKGTHADPA